MRVIVLGGAGDVGSRAVEAFAATPDVEQVTIADRDREGAERLAQALRSAAARVTTVAIDATDHDAVVRAVRGHDVAASTLGPFFRFEEPLARAAVEAGVPYTSICDDYSAAADLLERVDAPARAAEVPVLTGLGTTPGFSNVGIRYFADQLDRVRRADVTVYQPLDAGGGEAVLRHMLFIISGEIAAFRDGRARRVPACSESHVADFPRFGQLRVWNMGHAEPVTVPHFLPDIEECNYFMGFGRGSDLFIRPARWGWFTRPWLVEAAVKAVVLIEGLGPRKPPAPGALRLDVWGTRDGREVHHMACGIGEMREVTAQSLVVGTLQVGRGQLRVAGGGVFAPEACVDPVRFIAEMHARGVEAFEDLALTQSLSVGLPGHAAVV